MSLVVLLLCVPSCLQGRELSASGALAGRESSPAVVGQETRGKLSWFGGTYEQLLAQAAESKRMVFLDFYSRTNAFSKKLEKSTYCDAAVVTEMRDLLCFAVDADSKDSRALRKRFQVQVPPALVFLDCDGSLRDQLSGYLAPEPFLQEVRRIKKNTGTFSDLRARIRADAADLDARWDLACKLKTIGDLPGYEEQVAEIRERDRDGKSTASRRMHLSELWASASARLDLEPLYAFVGAEKDHGLLFEGWCHIWNLEGQLARVPRDPEAARMHELRYFAAARALWPLVPAEQYGILGNNIAWSFYENRSGATRSDLEFALGVAQKAVAAAPDIPAWVDTLACCLFAVGKREDALAQVERCIELDPQNSRWRERLAEFQAAK